MTRCFLGFELTEESRAYLRERLLPLHRALSGERHWPVRLVPPENWHATLLFFEGLEADERAQVWGEVERAVAAGAWRTLEFAWHGLALWPAPRRPALLCVEAERFAGAAAWPLAALAEQPPYSKGDTRHLLDYVPHITVMRFRKARGARLPRPRDWEAVQPLLPAIEAQALRFDRVSLFLSTVSPAQPVYPREHTLALAP
jgi:2'-5' RNA ligase